MAGRLADRYCLRMTNLLMLATDSSNLVTPGLGLLVLAVLWIVYKVRDSAVDDVLRSELKKRQALEDRLKEYEDR